MDIIELLLLLLLVFFFSALSLLFDSNKHSGSSINASTFTLNHVGAHVDKQRFPVAGFHFIDRICIYCVASCLMSTELSIIVRVVVGVKGEKMAFVATTQGFPGVAEVGRGLCIQPVSDISSAEFLPGPAPRPDSQTQTSSCEPSVRCVRSQRGGRTPITAALSRH